MSPGPQQPSTFPWPGKIIPWSAALRSGPTKEARTLADLPHGENVKVTLRSGGWLYVECRHESRKPLKGYVSRELIKHVQPTNTAGGSVQQNVKATVTPRHLGSQLQQKQTPPRNTSITFQLAQPKIIAIATDTYLKPTQFVVDPLLPGGHVLGFGQDLSFAKGRTQPHGPSVGTTTTALDGKMRRLLKKFASNDTRDFNNGLGVMINGVQHAIVVAKAYHLDRARNEYSIKLEYVFYDVFGLDDDDLKEYGANGGYDSDAAQGITAWWQLQFQHGYVPLITRIAFEREFRVPVPPAGGARR